jgi:hypothetical protein
MLLSTRRVRLKWANICRSSSHSVKPYEKYVSSETTSNVSCCYIVTLPETQCSVVPPHGPDNQNVKSIFEIDHLRESFGVTFLDTQCVYRRVARGFANLAL